MSVHRLCWVVVAASTILLGIGLLRCQFSDDNEIVSLLRKAAELMSAEEIYRYVHWTNTTACLLAVDFGFLVDISRGLWAADAHNGRKAVCLDQTIAPVYKNCLVYSFGVGHQQWTFEEDMAKFGCQVYSFDPSTDVVGDQQQHNRSRNINFYNFGLGDEAEDGRNLKSAWTIYQMLEDLHGPTTLIDVLKIDDLSEWVTIRQLLLSGFLVENVKQLVAEIHFKADDSLETYRQRARILQDLESPLVTTEESSGRFVRFSSRPHPTTKRPVAILLDGKEEYIGWEMAWYNLRYVLSRKLVD